MKALELLMGVAGPALAIILVHVLYVAICVAAKFASH